MAEKDTEPKELNDGCKEFMEESPINLNPSIDDDALNEDPVDTYNRATDDSDAETISLKVASCFV